MRTVNAVIAPSLSSRLLYYTLLSSLILAPVAATVHGLFFVLIAGVLSLPQLVNGILLAVLFVLLGAVQNPAGRIFSLFGPLLFLAFYCAVIAVAVSEPLLNLKEAVRMLFPCAVGMAAFVLAARGELGHQVLVRIAWWVLLLCVASQVVAYIQGRTIYENAYAAAGLGGQGGSAVALAMIVPFFFLSGRWRKPDILGVVLALASACATMLRSGILALLVLLLVCSVCRIVNRRVAVKDRLYSLLIPVGTAVVLAYALTTTGWGNAFSDRLADLDFTNGGTGSGRTELFAIGWEHLVSRSAFASLFGEGRARALEISNAALGSRLGTHNEWLTIILSFGVVGTLAYIIFHWKVTMLILRLRRSPLGVFEASAASLAAIVVVAVTGGAAILEPSVSPLFALLGYAAAIQHRRYFRIRLAQRYIPRKGGNYRAT